jgi:hypothetical protein
MGVVNFSLHPPGSGCFLIAKRLPSRARQEAVARNLFQAREGGVFSEADLSCNRRPEHNDRSTNDMISSLEFQAHCKLKNARVESRVNAHESRPERIDWIVEIHPVERIERLSSELNAKPFQRTKRLL